MMAKVPRNDEFLELYKLHAEFADRVSQRREGANRLYAGLLTGLIVAVSAVLKLVPSSEPVNVTILLGGILGAALSVSWYIVIRSYRQLNTGKFKALHELEKHLAYPFFTREWELLKKEAGYRSYWKLTIVETILPIIFFITFLSLSIFLFFME